MDFKHYDSLLVYQQVFQMLGEGFVIVNPDNDQKILQAYHSDFTLPASMKIFPVEDKDHPIIKFKASERISEIMQGDGSRYVWKGCRSINKPGQRIGTEFSALL